MLINKPPLLKIMFWLKSMQLFIIKLLMQVNAFILLLTLIELSLNLHMQLLEQSLDNIFYKIFLKKELKLQNKFKDLWMNIFMNGELILREYYLKILY